MKLNGAKIIISGDKVPEGESAVVIANHVGWSDFYMIQALALKAKMLGYCRYFAKAQLKKVPLLGWGLMAMGMPLVTRNCMFDPTLHIPAPAQSVEHRICLQTGPEKHTS